MSIIRWQTLVYGKSTFAEEKRQALPKQVLRMRKVRKTAEHKEWSKDYYAALKADPVKWKAKNKRARLRAQKAAVKKKRKLRDSKPAAKKKRREREAEQRRVAKAAAAASF